MRSVLNHADRDPGSRDDESARHHRWLGFVAAEFQGSLLLRFFIFSLTVRLDAVQDFHPRRDQRIRRTIHIHRNPLPGKHGFHALWRGLQFQSLLQCFEAKRGADPHEVDLNSPGETGTRDASHEGFHKRSVFQPVRPRRLSKGALPFLISPLAVVNAAGVHVLQGFEVVFEAVEEAHTFQSLLLAWLERMTPDKIGLRLVPARTSKKSNMAVLLTCESLEKAFGSRTIFSDISLSLHDGDRLGILGPNGAGKSTFLQILAGEMKADRGNISLRKGVRLAMVAQDPVFDPDLSVRDIVTAAAKEGEDQDVAVSKILSRTGFPDPWALAGTLSGGWKKRLAIAAALAMDPDVLLLDEPTNHLDVEGILWLEKLLNASPFASVFVTHDRYFLEDCCTRVAEINRAYPLGLFTAPGNYSKFLERRSEFLRAQHKEQAALENLVTREIEWLRRGAKARTSKSKARIQDAMELQEQLSDVNTRTRTGTATVDFAATGRQTKRLVVCDQVSKSLGGRQLFHDVSFILGPGTRLGILGANGSGKTTLLRVLTGGLEPDSGTVTKADALRVSYFEQERDTLDPEMPLRRALAPSGDTVIFRDRPQHVAGWAARFLFHQQQLDLPVGRLSGGERARVHIARLMLDAADVLILDEPTNDLDIPTLEVLEANLAEFPGALVLVTHDRFLLDRLSSNLLAIDSDGETEFYAELVQWEQANAARKGKPSKESRAAATVAVAEPKKKLSWKEAREWEQMEGWIAQADTTLESKQAQLLLPEVVSNPDRLLVLAREIEQAEAEVHRLFGRWSELEAKQQ